MNNEPVALTQGDILGILQDANSVPLGQPIFNSSEEYNKLKAIIESAIRYTHPAKEELDTRSYLLGRYDSAKTLTEWEIKECWEEATEGQEHFCSQYFDFAQLILRKAQE